MLEVKHVCYGIDGVPILKDISLGVQKGCIVTIVGPNGCGKSTLLKIISRILRPQSGEVLLDGCDAVSYTHLIHRQAKAHGLHVLLLVLFA